MSSSTEVKHEVYGKMPDGRDVKVFTLCNRNGVKACVMEYGAILLSVETPDRAGNLADVTHGFDTLEDWLGNASYFGATVGRFGNRIKDGRFELDGKEYSLVTNNEPGGLPCHLHGGLKGFDKVLWSGTAVDGNRVEFSYVSPDGEEGYPGTLTVKVVYSLNEENELTWEATATTDAPTIVNMVHHSYWNLSGDPRTSINDHEMMIAAPSFLSTDRGLIPTGELTPVAGTPMDFTRASVIGDRIEADYESLVFGGGYDHCWVLEEGSGLRTAARVKDPKSGRVMEVLTNQPAVQFYAGNFIDGAEAGKGGVRYGRRSGLCLETEGFPDSPNRESFPSPVLRPGETYRHLMVHKFSAE